MRWTLYTRFAKKGQYGGVTEYVTFDTKTDAVAYAKRHGLTIGKIPGTRFTLATREYAAAKGVPLAPADARRSRK